MYYIGGDFNADLLKSNSDINIKDFMNLTYSLGCIPLITLPTRITTTSSTLLDHVYTNNGILYTSPKNTFQKLHFPEKHLAETTLSRT